MKHFIEHIIEPEKLLLAWQAPDSRSRGRHIIAELTREGEQIRLHYLLTSKMFKRAQELGFLGHPAFKKTDRDYTVGVLEAFMRRLPPRNRGDFPKYLELQRIHKDAKISDFALLGYTGAKLPNDGFSIIHPFEGVSTPCEFLTEVAGFRYYKDLSIEDIHIGQLANLEPEPDNKFDPEAIRVMIDNKKIGYINRGQVKTFHRWLEEGQVKAIVERINGRPVRPGVYLFIQFLPTLKQEWNSAIA